MPDVLPLRLEQRGAARIRPDLARLRAALSQLGNPHVGLRSVLVVGTNGKGSTSAMVERILAAHGARTGLFTSPHLLRVEERIRLPHLAGDTEQTLVARCLARVEALPELTYFEAVTAAAFLAFAEAQVDCAVLEAGMGGSWDATRVAGSAIAGLTNVGTDHRHWLGPTREHVAADKGAALAAARYAVLGPGVDAAIVAAVGAPHARPASELVAARPDGEGRLEVTIGATRARLAPPLAGAHQIANLTLALALAEGAARAGFIGPLRLDRIGTALGQVAWPGRLSEHQVLGRRVTLDCAHNLEAAAALAAHLSGSDRRFNLLFSCLDDKPLEAMAELLAPVVGQVAVCPLEDERAMPLARLAAAYPEAVVAPTVNAGLAALADPVLAAGSVRLAGALLALGTER